MGISLNTHLSIVEVENSFAPFILNKYKVIYKDGNRKSLTQLAL